MAANTVPIFPGSVYLGVADLVGATAVTNRANITGTTGLVKLTDLAANAGLRVDAIRIKCKGTSVAGLITIWLYDGITSRVYDEIPVSAVTASTTVDSFTVERPYSTLNLTPTQQLYVSETVVNDATIAALGGVF